jgi:hypothetical protein
MTRIEQLDRLRQQLIGTKSDMLVALGRALFLALNVFIWLAGFLFTLLPLVGNVWRYLLVLNDNIARWLWEDQATGWAFTILGWAFLLTMVLYLTRKHVWLVALMAAEIGLAALLWARAQATRRTTRTGARPPAPAQNTDIVAG